MDLQSYAFGILTVVAAVIAVVTIVGVVKVYKLSAGLKELDNRFCTVVDDIYRNIGEESKIVQTQLEKEIRDVKSYVDSRIDKLGK